MTFKQILAYLAIAAIAVLSLAFSIHTSLSQTPAPPTAGDIGGTAIYGALTLGSATVTTSNTLVLATSTARIYAAICNDGSNTIYLAAGTAAVSGNGIPLEANGGCYEINDQNPITAAVYAVTSSASSNVTVLYK